MKAQHRSLAQELRATVADIDRQLEIMQEEHMDILSQGDAADSKHRYVASDHDVWDAVLKSKYPDGTYSAVPLLAAKSQALSALAVLAADK